jgi:hypothetical protein
MKSLSVDLTSGSACSAWEPGRRFVLRCEIDAAFFHLYGIERDDAAHVLDSFNVVRDKDEKAFNGDYRTKRVILEIYDALAEATRTGRAYVSSLASRETAS